MKKRAIIFIALCIAMRLGFEGVSEIFYLNVTSSLPQGLYMKIPSREFSRGDYIVYEPLEEVREIIIKNSWGDGKHD